MSIEITAADFLKKATRAAEHFGFRSAENYRKNPVCKNCKTKFSHSALVSDRRIDALNGMLTAGINAYTENKLHAIEDPVLYYSIEQVPRTGEIALALQIFNVEKSIAEALLIQTARIISSDLGYSDHIVRINSLGDSDSVARYTRELTNFLRKRITELPPSARELMKEHVCSALMHLIEKEHELAHRSPNALEYLSDTSRKHFREIIEYLDITATPYEIDPKLIGHFNCYSDALFAIDLVPTQDNPNPQLYIRGGRYNTFMYQHTKQTISAAGTVIILKEKKAPLRLARIQTMKPSVYVVQLGFGPKIQSLMLIDMLRKADIATFQNLASDSLSAQLRDAESRQVKYTIIIGQKEYVDGTVIIRDMIARNQEHITVDSIVSYLKRTNTQRVLR